MDCDKNVYFQFLTFDSRYLLFFMWCCFVTIFSMWRFCCTKHIVVNCCSEFFLGIVFCSVKFLICKGRKERFYFLHYRTGSWILKETQYDVVSRIFFLYADTWNQWWYNKVKYYNMSCTLSVLKFNINKLYGLKIIFQNLFMRNCHMLLIDELL